MSNIPFHSKLLSLNFENVCFYDFSDFLYENYNQTIFEPLKTIIPRSDYKLLLEPWFPNSEELVPLANQYFFEYMRMQVLNKNGFHVENGY
jgi:hypothetical protein